MTEEIKNQETEIKENTEAKKPQQIQLPNFISMESALGAVMLLANRSQSHKHLFITDMEWLVIPPVMLKQFAIFRTQKNEPMAFISWASINEETEKRLLTGNVKLKPQEWKSGDKLYIIDMLSPFGANLEVLKQLKEKQFKNKDVYLIRPKKDNIGVEKKLLRETIKEMEELRKKKAENMKSQSETKAENKVVN